MGYLMTTHTNNRKFLYKLPDFAQGPIHGFAQVLEQDTNIRDRTIHRRLKADLVEHIWQKFGNQPQQN